ncbi:MAG TPA: DNA methyltransferase [Candidatus Acidoferrum sp.]|nr:DNA methyltransferase [Candidatus Acidoferrum sp.]
MEHGIEGGIIPTGGSPVTAEHCPKKKKRKAPQGVATNKLVFSAYQGSNDGLFPHVLSLYVAPGSTVADVTYGNGVFWRKIPKGTYRLKASDIRHGVDATKLPYRDGSLDCVVFDPPYMHTPGGSAHKNHQNYEEYYRNNVVQAAEERTPKKYHEAVLDLYFKAAKEAHRVLRDQGVYIVKCGDEVCANQQRLTHVEIINELSVKGFVTEDLFILLRNNLPGVSRVLRQSHAKKNHSYFIVFRKSSSKTRWKGLPTRELARPMHEDVEELPLFQQRTEKVASA